MRVGMIGAGSIAGIMAGTIEGTDCAQDYAVVTRDYRRAVEFTQKYDFKKACGSYEGLVGDAGVEPVYITTPHSHHYGYIRLYLNHEKHILCERSSTVDESQAREMLELARERKLLLTEAIRTRYMSMKKTLDDVLLSGVIGRPYMLTINLGYIISGRGRIMCPELAGGALLDMGVYPPNFASMMFGDEVDTITGTAVMAETDVDAQNDITITYKDDRMAVLCSSTMELSDRRGIIYGGNGPTEVENINNCEGIWIYDRSRDMVASYDTPRQTNGYECEVKACLRAVEEGALECPEMPHKEALQTIGWMDELRRQWRLVCPMRK